jgi:cysteinyl-tRNA synthetase
VNYFVHAGHLNIEGRKMAKSLKNFITIKEALQTYTAKQIRMMFVLHKYDTTMNYSEGALEEAKERERQVSEFVLHARAALRAHRISETQKLKQADKDLLTEFRTRQTQIHAALCDNLSTDAAMDIITDIINKANLYMEKADFKALALTAIYKYVIWIMSVFGLNYEGSGESRSSEEVVGPVADAVMAFRERVRAAARDGNTKAVLEACDQVRDVGLLRAGVRIEDKPTGPVWMLLDPATAEAEIKAKTEADQAKLAAKEKARVEKEAQEEVKRKKAMVPPGEMFRVQTEKYSAWDERGLPTHDAAGQDLSKTAKKNVQKEYEKQEKLHAKYLESQSPPAS